MPAAKTSIEDLIVQHLKKELSGEEERRLDAWLARSERNRMFFNTVTDKKRLREKLLQFHSIATESSEAEKEKLREQLGLPVPEPARVKKITSWKSRSALRRRMAVAAAIIIIAVTGYFILLNKPPEQVTGITGQPQEARFKNDVAPGSYKAKLTLADGTTIILDSTGTGMLATQGGTAVLNKNGRLIYQPGQSAEVLYNTLTTGNGETYATVLVDGSKVWLNAGSAITYPVAFTGSERKVQITGEAYFEVAPSFREGTNDKIPFYVTKGDMTVQVLGTHFNVNAYDDEKDIKVTLLEGSVKVSNKTDSKLIKPGQQVSGTTNSPLGVGNIDIERVMAWKNGAFDFEDVTLVEAMRQLERWYDVSVEIEPGVPVNAPFYGQVSRKISLNNLVKLFEKSDLKFRIENGKKLIVSK